MLKIVMNMLNSIRYGIISFILTYNLDLNRICKRKKIKINPIEGPSPLNCSRRVCLIDAKICRAGGGGD